LLPRHAAPLDDLLLGKKNAMKTSLALALLIGRPYVDSAGAIGGARSLIYPGDAGIALIPAGIRMC